MFHNTSFFFHIIIEKNVCHDCVWYDEDLERIYQKLKILTLGHIFAYNSKSILPQRASFSHSGAHNCYLYSPLYFSIAISLIVGPVGGCPLGWYKLRDRCYKLGGGPDNPTDVQTWYDARGTCATEGPNGHLASVTENGLQGKKGERERRGEERRGRERVEG